MLLRHRLLLVECKQCKTRIALLVTPLGIGSWQSICYCDKNEPFGQEGIAPVEPHVLQAYLGTVSQAVSGHRMDKGYQFAGKIEHHEGFFSTVVLKEMIGTALH